MLDGWDARSYAIISSLHKWAGVVIAHVVMRVPSKVAKWLAVNANMLSRRCKDNPRHLKIICTIEQLVMQLPFKVAKRLAVDDNMLSRRCKDNPRHLKIICTIEQLVMQLPFKVAKRLAVDDNMLSKRCKDKPRHLYIICTGAPSQDNTSCKVVQSCKMVGRYMLSKQCKDNPRHIKIICTIEHVVMQLPFKVAKRLAVNGKHVEQTVQG